MKKQLEKAYNEILEVLHRYKDISIFNSNEIKEIEKRCNTHLFGVELVEKYGLNINPKSIYSSTYQELTSNIVIIFMDGENTKISWSDDGKQPKNETLLEFKFPTGAYIFGDYYPKELFNEFFIELKSYSPKYSDTVNKCLYFSLDNAANIFNSFNSIYTKYNNKVQDYIKKERIAQLEKELKLIKNG